MSRRKYVLLILILGTLTALAPFSIDMYLPGFPAIAKDLNTSIAHVSLSLTGFFIGISAGQLLYGPLLDRFGRKKPLYIGLMVYIASSIYCSMVHDIDTLIAVRFIQAIGSCAATVASVAMVRDLFPVKDSAKVFALLVLVLGASPMLAPTIGGYITAAFGWHTIFLVLTGIGVAVLLASIFILPESFKPNTSLSLKPGPIIRGFWEVFTEPQFYTYTFTGAIAFAGLFAYVSGSPMVFMKVFGLSGKVYGWVFAFLSIGFIGCSQLNTLLLKKYNSEQLIRVVLICYVLIAVSFCIVTQLDYLTLPACIVFLLGSLGCVGMTNPNASSMALAPFSQNAGTASALMGALQMGIGAGSSMVISLFEAPSVKPMATTIACSAVGALLVFTLGKRTIQQKYVGGDAVVVAH